MVDFAIDDFDLSDHTAKWTVDPDAIFWCGSSMGCSMMLHTMVATGPGKPITLPAFANKANLAGVIHQWGSLPDVAGGGGIYMTFNEDDPFFDVGDKPILIEHGTHDNLQTESGMLLTPWTAAVALYRDALNVEIPFTEIIPLMQAHHSPWASHHSEIAYGMRDWIARVMAGESTPVIQTELDKELVPEVYTLIDELGEAVIFEVADGLLYSLKITPPEPFQDSFIDNDVIREGDLTTYVAAKDIPFTPAPGIKMTLESKDYTVIKVSPIYTGELIALYTLHLR